MTFYLFIYSRLYSCHAMYLSVLFQKECHMEDWFYQMDNPLKIKNLLTYLWTGTKFKYLFVARSVWVLWYTL